jgi:N-acetylmuramoyl-L-alanine amidase
MIYIKKKALGMIAIILAIFMTSYVNNMVQNNSTIEVAATPVSGRVVIIDAGHGKPDRTGQLEEVEH